MRELFRLRNLRICILGNTVTMIGDNAFWLAASIWVKELTGSTARAGVVILCLTVGTMLSPLTGVLVDRFRRKRLLMVTEAVTALLMLTLVTVDGPGQVWLIYLMMFLYGCSAAITSGAFAALREQLMPACRLYTYDAADDMQCVNFGDGRFIQKKQERDQGTT